jgi:hypothetical protein
MLPRAGLVGLRGDATWLWQAASAEPCQELMTAILSTSLAPYLEMPYSLLAITRRLIMTSARWWAATAEERIVSTGRAPASPVPAHQDARVWLPFEKRQR